MSQEEKSPKARHSKPESFPAELAADETPDGAVPIQTVTTVLSACGISFKTVDEGAFVLYKDGVPEGLQLPLSVRRKMLHRIAYKYNLKIEWFYHPEMVCNGPKTSQ
jgi:hypothetical protein